MTTKNIDVHTSGDKEDMRERRRAPRFRVPSQGVVMLTPDPVISFTVFDVSRGGLSFAYAGWRQWAEDPLKMDFLAPWVVLEKAPVLVVSDVALTPLAPDGERFPLRRCSVRFGELDGQQVARLASYLSSISDEA